MAGLLEKIKDLYPDQARELEKENFRSDNDIRTLTKEDLQELLGPKNLKQRKAVYELIHQQKPIGDLLKDLKAFIPAESLEAALTENGVLSGYLQIMKDLTSQVGKVQSFLQAHVSLLEEHSYDYKAAKGTHPGGNVQKGSNLPLTQTSFGDTKEVPSSSSPESGQRDGPYLRSDTDPDPYPSNVDPDEPLGAHKAQPVAEVSSSVATQQISMTEKLHTVTFQSIVSGKTLNCENTILEQLRNRGKVILKETEDTPQLIIVFCPITSRIDSDLESVMNRHPESLVDKPVILVMMHHRYNPNEGVIQKPGSVLKKWNIALVVNVFYHETVHGLVPCVMNNQAVDEMHTTLMKRCEKSICECVNDSDIAMSDPCGHNSSASESLVRSGNDNMALLAHECNTGTSSNVFSQRTSSSSSYGSHDNRGGRVPSVDTRPSGSQGNPKGMVYNVAIRHSSLRGDNDTCTSGFHGNQVGYGGNARTRNSTDGDDHSAGKVDQGTRAGFKNPL
ncbi:uncharacterized protein si:ch211-245h14.1 isoform X2 [Gadus macrocephalus]|uniref:uncharacterized protein si:ch211-245h14.1 isoform X2 n=1 Tax=Gadus macrocephalus TaxID=80720 RepID=UPI0028CB3B4C|nr:uncharacterized protein si:ch211-245h14.1 isoform X2 [Gadus macrocephalus]